MDVILLHSANSPEFMETRRFITFFPRTCHCFLSWAWLRSGNIAMKSKNVWIWQEQPSLFADTVPLFIKRIKWVKREALMRPGFELIIFRIKVRSVRSILTARYSGNLGIYFCAIFSVEFARNLYQLCREEFFFTTVWTDVRIYRAGIIDNQWFISIMALVVAAKYL
jgi:hypothetical protein